MDAKTVSVQVVKSFLSISIALVSIIGNTMVLAVVYRNRRLRTLTNAYIINLAVSDILMAVLCMPLTTTSLITVEWSMGDAACKFQGILGVSLSFISLQTMTLTAVNRYFRIVRPGKYPSIFTKRSAIIMIAAIWLVGLNFGELYVWASGGEIVFIQTAGTCFPRIVPLVVSILGYLLPSILIFVCYFLVYKAVRRHSLTVTCSLQRGEQPLGPSCEELNTTKILFFVMLGFILCWVPTQVIGLILAKIMHTLPPEYPWICFTLIYLSCAINPVIYGVMNHKFRKEFKKLISSMKQGVVEMCSALVVTMHFRTKPGNQQEELVLQVIGEELDEKVQILFAILMQREN